MSRKRSAKETSCRLLKQRRTEPEETLSIGKFKSPVVIGDEDFLSQLPADSLDIILTKLNHDELDVLARVSQTMLKATVFSRSRAIRCSADELIISQNEDCKVSVGVGTKRECGSQFVQSFGLTLTKESKSFAKKFVKSFRLGYYADLALSEITPIDRTVMNNLVHRLDRFTFKNIRIASVGINDDFVNAFEAVGFDTMNKIWFENCAFDTSFSPEAKSRFLSLLIASKSKYLQLEFLRGEVAKVFDTNFIRSFAEAVKDADLWIGGNEQFSLPVNRDSMQSLLLYKQLYARTIVMEPQVLLDMILDRLEKERSEVIWHISVTDKFTDTMLSRVDTEKYYRPFKNVIAKRDTKFEVVFKFTEKHGRFDANVRFRELLP